MTRKNKQDTVRIMAAAVIVLGALLIAAVIYLVRGIALYTGRDDAAREAAVGSLRECYESGRIGEMYRNMPDERSVSSLTGAQQLEIEKYYEITNEYGYYIRAMIYARELAKLENAHNELTAEQKGYAEQVVEQNTAALRSGAMSTFYPENREIISGWMKQIEDAQSGEEPPLADRGGEPPLADRGVSE